MTAFAAALLLALIAPLRPGDAAETFALQLNGPANFEFAGYYAALWQGFYKEAGLDVSIRPGAASGEGAIDPVRELVEGRAQFGTGTAQLAIRAAQGLPILLLAPIFQRSGAAVYYRADSEFSSPASLAKARLGRTPASDILDIELATALRAEGVDPATLKTVPIAPGQQAAALANHTIDAAIGTAWTTPWEAYERGLTLKSFNPANYRVEFYGDSLFTLQRFAERAPDTVRRFRAASLKGWNYALQHPQEIEARLIAEHPSPFAAADVTGFLRYQGDVAQRLARFPDIQLGYANPDRWTQIATVMVGVGALSSSADLSGFVYDSDIAPAAPAGSSRRLWVIVGAAAVAVAAGLALLWMVWVVLARRKASAATTTAKTAKPPPAPAPTPAAAPLPAPVPVPVPVPVAAPPPEPAPARVAPAVDLNAVLAPLERRVRQRVRGKVRCRFSLLPELWRCRADSEAVPPLVLDLVGAAVKIADSDGSLIVGTRNFAFTEEMLADHPDGQVGEFARITVRDSGPGLSDEEYAAILDPERSARPAIAHVAAAVERLGGFARVESAVGIGTAVHLYFARVDEAAAAPPESEPEPAAQVAE